MNTYLYIIANIIAFILAFTLFISIYVWIEELEKNGCECSKLWHQKFLQISSIILLINTIIFNVLKVSMSLKSKFISEKISNYIYFIIMMISLLVLPYMIILLDFIIKLKEMQDCKCSEDWKREYGYYFSIIYLIYIGIIVSLSVLSLIILKILS